jgi:hypothetical protein
VEAGGVRVLGRVGWALLEVTGGGAGIAWVKISFLICSKIAINMSVFQFFSSQIFPPTSPHPRLGKLRLNLVTAVVNYVGGPSAFGMRRSSFLSRVILFTHKARVIIPCRIAAFGNTVWSLDPPPVNI